LTYVVLRDIITTTMTISTSLVFYLYMDIQKIKWMKEWKTCPNASLCTTHQSVHYTPDIYWAWIEPRS